MQVTRQDKWAQQHEVKGKEGRQCKGNNVETEQLAAPRATREYSRDMEQGGEMVGVFGGGVCVFGGEGYRCGEKAKFQVWKTPHQTTSTTTGGAGGEGKAMPRHHAPLCCGG